MRFRFAPLLLLLLSFIAFLPVSAHAAPSVSLVPSRTTGVAPLGVTFDATGTTDPSVTTRPFHDLEYTWNFGDDDSITWSNGARPGVNKKNRATGPVSAHVYETPGTYTVTLSVYDDVTTATQTQTITVTDPNSVYTGTNTICFSTSSTFTDCPSGAQQVATSTFDSALALYRGTNKRLLFRRGETFNSLSPGNITDVGPMTIGAYGSGDLPHITSNAVIAVITMLTGARDVRVMDLNITGSGSSDQIGYGESTQGIVSDITFLRLTMSDIGAGMIIASGSGMGGTLIQDCHIYNIGRGVGFFGWIYNSGYLGNYIGPFTSTAEHNVRIQPAQKVVVSDNTITTPGTSGKAVLTLRALEHTPDALDPNTHPAPDTQYVYSSDNKLIGVVAYPAFQIGPASIGQNDWIYDVISDRDWIVIGPGTADGYDIEASDVTVRNSLCQVTDATGGRQCFVLGSANYAGVPPPNNVHFYNNTCYNGVASNFRCVWLSGSDGPPVTNTIIKNNLAYAPVDDGGVAPKVLTCGSLTLNCSGNGTVASNNSTDLQAKTINPFVSSSPVNYLDFMPAASSYAVGGGTFVQSALSDFLNALRGGIPDIGAFQYSPATPNPTPTPPPPPPPPPAAPTPPPSPSPAPTPTPASAPTPAPVVSVSSTPHTGLTEAQIQAILSLLTSFNADGTTIAKVNAALRGTTPPSSSSSTSYTFTRNLQLYSTGPDVQNLQKYLNTHGYPIATTGNGSLGKESLIFGPATMKALAKFQSAHHLKPTGYFGPLTRALIGK